MKALAVFRIAVGLAVLADLARWLGDFSFFFTSEGPLTLSGMVVDTKVGKTAFSLYNASTHPILAYLLFLATGLAALALVLGWRCRISAPVLWVLLLSLQNRAAVALDRGDAALLLGLSLGLLLPWDRALSLGPASTGKPLWVIAAPILAVAVVAPWIPGQRLDQAAAFFALGPRAAASSDYWYVVVGMDQSGRRWSLDSPERPPDFARPERPEESYRKQLYRGGLRDPDNWGLRYWLALRYFQAEQRRLGSTPLKRIEIYQCDQGQSHLFARWPMQDAP
jgi:hypothetical protein